MPESESNAQVTGNAYRPSYAVSPGEVLEEMIETQEMSQAEFARRCGRSAKLISEIISAKAPIEPETALQFERVLGMDASVWLNLEARYRLYQAQVAEARELSRARSWAEHFPVPQLVKLRVLPKPSDSTDTARKLLNFFGVGTVDAWQQQFSAVHINYRHSPTFESSQFSIATWIRMAELRAKRQEADNYDRAKFIEVLREIRNLTTLKAEEFEPEMRRLCATAGVIFVPVRPVEGLKLSGAAWWLSPRRAVIQQSLRHKSNDHFWFTFFHEAAHILLHSKKDVFVDEAKTDGNPIEHEANEWAEKFLAPSLNAFCQNQSFSHADIVTYAREEGIAPGIVVGMLQHREEIPWSHFNDLKKRFQWNDDHAA